MRAPNTQECEYFGRKLSCLSSGSIETSLGYVVVGSERDDQIYYGSYLDEDQEMLKERVKITCIYEPDEGEGFMVSIDLEDVLRFAAFHCRGIYDRVLEEIDP